MLKEAFQFLTALGAKAETPTIITAPSEPSHVYYLRDAAGVKRVEAEPPPDKHQAFSLDAIIGMAESCVLSGSIWYGPEGVVLRLDDTGRNTIDLVTKLSDPFVQLQQWRQNKPSLTQADLIRSLRITFRECLSPAGEILAVLKRVKFNASQSSDSEISNGKFSVGKSLTAEVTGTGTLPEYLKLLIPVWANPCFRAVRTVVECALEADAATATFRVIPLPGQLEEAIDYATSMVGRDLANRLEAAKNGIAVHYGRP